MGLRLDWLGTDRLSWRDLLVIVRQSPPSTALYRAHHPDEWQWGLSEQLIALVADHLAIGNWQHGNQHGKKHNFPKPIPRPGVEPTANKLGSDPIPLEEMADWLGWSEQVADVVVRLDKNGRPMPNRGPDGRFVKT